MAAGQMIDVHTKTLQQSEHNKHDIQTHTIQTTPNTLCNHIKAHFTHACVHTTITCITGTPMRQNIITDMCKL